MRSHQLTARFLVVFGVFMLLLASNIATFAQSSGSYTASPGTPISESSPASSSIVVNDSFPITDLNVAVNIAHSHSGDLSITLTSPAGTTVPLLNSLGGGFQYGCGADGISVAFDDSAGAPLDSYACGDFEAAVMGTWRPSGSLAAFNGQNANGTWILTVTDRLPSDSGTLNAWGLVVNPAEGSGGGVIGAITGGGGGFSVPLCADFDGSTNEVVVADFEDTAFDIFCRIIAENSEFIRTGGEVGVDAVLEQGVIHAVDVYSPNGTNPNGSEVCLQGRGGVLFLNAADSPRVPVWLPTSVEGSYTCIDIPAQGTIVLVENTPDGVGQRVNDDDDTEAAAGADDGRLTSVSAGISLTNCRITTTHMVNIRSAPSLDSVVLDRLPFESNLQATERTEEWFRVIYLDFQGWVSIDYLEPSGACGMT